MNQSNDYTMVKAQLIRNKTIRALFVAHRANLFMGYVVAVDVLEHRHMTHAEKQKAYRIAGFAVAQQLGIKNNA